MGNLHAGHLSLVDVARTLADRVVVSIFVNPTQFGPGEDFAAYPRTLDKDRRQLTRANVDILFAPPVEEIYPRPGAARAPWSPCPDCPASCAAQFRPGHFDGVASVVTRLFNIVQPDSAVFGQKDYQQLLVIRRLQADLHLPVKIVAAPTAREPDGLALSSRNQYLDGAQRAHGARPAPGACRLRRGCCGRAAGSSRRWNRAAWRALVAAGFRPDYFAIRNAADLSPPIAASRNLVVLAAGHLGRARLIDNVLVDLAVGLMPPAERAAPAPRPRARAPVPTGGRRAPRAPR